MLNIVLRNARGAIIRPLAKPAYNEEMQGAFVAQNPKKCKVVHKVHEYLRNGGTRQLPLEVGLCKRSNQAQNNQGLNNLAK